MPFPARLDGSKIARAYQKGASVIELARRYKVSRTAIYGHLAARGVPPRRKHRKRAIPSLKKFQVVSRYKEGWTMGEIADKLRLSKDKVSKILHDNRVNIHQGRPYSILCRTDVLGTEENRLSQEQQYWCGYLMGRVCYSTKQGGYGAQMSVQATKEDKHHLLKLAEFLGVPNRLDRMRDGKQFQLRWRATAWERDRWQMLGIFPRSVDRHLLSKRLEPYLGAHFLRGLIDGGGNISCLSYKEGEYFLRVRIPPMRGIRRLLLSMNEYPSTSVFRLVIHCYSQVDKTGLGDIALSRHYGLAKWHLMAEGPYTWSV